MRVLGCLASGFSLLGLIACSAPDRERVEPDAARISALGMTSQEAAAAFTEVVARVEPVAEQECRAAAPEMNCDYRIRIDLREDEPPNAFQSVDSKGRPVITFTIALVSDAQSPDELAFILGHEAAHHIGNHLTRQRKNAEAGAVVYGGLATFAGSSAAQVAHEEQIGAKKGARSYSKDFELEADEIGTVIAARAGYNPLLGAAFFDRFPDPGDKFLGTHPPNAARLEAVRRKTRELGLL